MNRLNDAGFSGAVLLLDGERTILKKGYGFADRARGIENAAATLFYLASVSKQFTAAAILLLESRGELALDDSLATFFAEVPPDKAGITIHQLLTHTAGLPTYYARRLEGITKEEALRRIFDAPLESGVGEKYAYSNTGYALLAMIVEEVSGRPFGSFVEDNLFRPAGMATARVFGNPWADDGVPVAREYTGDEDTGTVASWPGNRPGQAWAHLGSGGVVASLNDLHLWEEALRNNTILTPGATDMLMTPYVKTSETGTYGYGWRIAPTSYGGKLVYHYGSDGAYTSAYLRFVDRDVVLFVLGNHVEDDDGGYVGYGTETALELNRRIFDNDFSILPAFAR